MNPKELRIRQWLYARVGFVAMFALYATVLLAAKNPPAFMDYPDWVYQGVLFHGVLTHSPIPGYVLKAYPVPNALTTIGIALLNLMMSWQWAGKIWICTYFIFAIFASFRLARVLRITNYALWLALPGTVFLNLNFWYGHINFEYGVCTILFFLSMLLEPKLYRTGYAWVLVALFFTHMEACACGVLLFLCFCVCGKYWKQLWQSLPAGLLTAWYSIGRLRGGNLDSSGAVSSQYRYASVKFMVFKFASYFKTLGYVNAMGINGVSKTEAILGRPLMLLLAGLSIVMGCVLAILLLCRLFKEIRQQSETRFVWIFTLLLSVIAMLLPQQLLGTSDPGSRLILIAVVVTLFLTGQYKNRATHFFAYASLALCFANLWQFVTIEENLHLIAARRDLPLAIMEYAHVVPEARLNYYRSLETGTLDRTIFPTALFYEKPRNQDPSRNGAGAE
jgi:hypothetical protein